MATMSVLRCAGARSLSRLLGPQLLSRMAPIAGTLVPKSTLMVTQPKQKRLYGPELGGHSDTGMWRNERIAAIALIPLIPAGILVPSMPMDFILSAALVLHCHWRLSGVCEDYIHGELLPKIHQPFVLVMSILAFGSLCYLNYSDVGLGNAVRMLYSEL
ncbi:hypothetical protein NP493_669g01014 [Ridgeia piscesae]|uniref:Succinate dehydrogenase [ubiquinone] cytochrome b small subunit n=1 Tax=Ridgeia piscesae TaxID=27915 RepID=A0AAD9KRN9_RIDPI|nr:hypothetical protein NP493_669g01014 [Ridgeia piscesae]